MIRSVVLFTHVIGMLVQFFGIAFEYFEYDVIYAALSQRCVTHVRGDKAAINMENGGRGEF